MGQLNSNQLAFLAALRVQLSKVKVTTSLKERNAIINRVAAEYKIIFVPQVSYSAGVQKGLGTAGLNISGVLTLNPMSPNESVFSPQTTSLQAVGDSGIGDSVQFQLSPSGFDYAEYSTATNVVDPGQIANYIMPDMNGSLGVVAKDGAFVIKGDGPLAVDNPSVRMAFGNTVGKVLPPTVNVEYSFQFRDAEDFWPDITKTLYSITNEFNSSLDRNEDHIELNSVSIEVALRARFDAAMARAATGDGRDLVNLSTNYQAQVFVDVFKQYEQKGGTGAVSMRLPAGLGGLDQATVTAEIGRRGDGQSGTSAGVGNGYYIIVRSTPLLGSAAENEAYQVNNYYVVDDTGKQLLAPSTVSYNFESTLGNRPGADYKSGVTYTTVTGARGNTGPFEDENSLARWVGNYTDGYKLSCFVASTRILLSDGSEKFIEEVNIGDRILSYDECDPLGPLVDDLVTNIFESEVEGVVDIGFLTGTANHPLLTPDGQFVALGDVHSLGKQLVDRDGTFVDSGPSRAVSGKIKVYNLQVAKNHTYVANGIRVHNKCLHLDGSEGYVTFDSSGNAFGLYFSGSDGLSITEFNAGGKTAKLTEINRSKISHTVWEDVDQAKYGTSNVPPEMGAINQPLSRDTKTRQIIKSAYLSDEKRLAEIDAAGSIGSILGGALGSYIFDDDPLERIIGSTVFSVIGENLAEFVENSFSLNLHLKLDTSRTILSDLGDEFASAGIGAVSSFLVSELIQKIGVDGFPGEILNSTAGAVIGKILENISGLTSATSAFAGVNPALIGSAIGSFLGAKLASEIVHFDTIGGQLGSSIGASLGVIGVTAALSSQGALLGVQLGSFGGPVAAAIGAFLGFIVGGLIGSIFGGIPRSGADVSWDEKMGEFAVANAYARKGGSKDAATSLASAVAETFNNLLTASGSRLADPGSVQTGNYGMWKSDFVYRPISTRDESAITRHFSGKEAASQLIGYGVYQGLSDQDFQLVGGDAFVKRAIYNSLALSSEATFDPGALLGDVSIAQRYESYLLNTAAVNAVISAEPNSLFTAEWGIVFARANELGLNRRHQSDWFGGFTALMSEAGNNAASVVFGLSPGLTSGQYERLFWLNGYTIGDTIDASDQTAIVAASNNDIIDLRSGGLANQVGYTVNGHVNNDIAVSGSDFAAKTAILNLAANSRTATGTVATIADSLVEAGEKFDVALSNANGVKIVGPDAVVTIVDAAALPTLMVGRSYAAEGDGYAVFRVSLSKAATAAVTLGLALEAGRATEGVDYTAGFEVSADGVSGWASATSVTFAAGAMSYFVRVAVLSDNGVDAEGKATNVEGNESFSLIATITAGAAALANGTTAVAGKGTIIDGVADTPYAWIDDQVVHEGSSAGLWVTRSRVTTGAASVSYTTSDRTKLEIPVAATVDGGDGDDTIYASNLGDNVFGGAGNDTLYGGRLDDWLLGGDGNDILDAGTQGGGLGGDGNYLDGGAGNDILRGREGSDWLEGGDGVDTLTGGTGDDILAGGAGEGDNLKGGLGDDQYLVRLGDGADLAEDEATGAPAAQPGGDYISQRFAGLLSGIIKKNWVGDAAGVAGKTLQGGEDAIVFGQGIDMGDIMLFRSSTDSDDLIIRVMQTVNGVATFSGTQLTVKDWFSDPFKRVEWLKFADGNEVRIGDITSFVIGGSGNDVLIGTAGNDFVYGGAGDDALHLLAGNDIGNGGTGNDLIAGDSGSDLLLGGLGMDELIGGKGADVLSGDGGADDLYGGNDADILSGGRGDGDQIVGGAGNDTFKYSRGDGRDTMFDDFSANWQTVWTGGTWNTAAGYAYNEATGEVTGPNGVYLRKNLGTATAPDLQWVGRFDYDSDTGTLRYFSPPAGAAIVANAGTDTIEFAPGIDIQDIVLWRPAGSNDLVLSIGSENAEFSTAASITDSVTIKDWYLSPGQIEKLAFYQTGILDISAGATNLIAGTDAANGTTATPLSGTVGADWITGGAGDDVVSGGAGNDIISGNSGSDTLKGESGDDVIYGGAGNDSLDGGLGADTLIGGTGFDTASYLSAGSGVKAYLSASFANTGDASGDQYASIENLAGGGGGDELGGDESDNDLTGGQGADTLLGGEGDDTYFWNTGDGADVIRDASFAVEEAVTVTGALSAGYTQSIWQSTGVLQPGFSNRYYWRLQITGPGGEIVYDYDRFAPTDANATQPNPQPGVYNVAGWLGGFAKSNGQQVTRAKFDASVNAGDDVLEFGAGISLSDLTFITSGVDLIVQVGGSATSQVTIKDHFAANGNSRVETLQFRDGLAVSLASILTAVNGNLLTGTAGNDLMIGQAGTFADQLDGGAGDDVLSGGGGADRLLGGTGDDQIEGGAGADLIDGGTHSASTVTGWGDTARYVRSTAGVQVDLHNTTTGQAGGDAAGDVLVGIENLTGSDLADTLTGNEGGNRIDGLDGDNIIRGNGGDDILIAGAGADKLYGGAGDDGIAAGAGNDELWGGDGKDQLNGGDGNDTLYGEAGNDALTGGDGNDILDAGDGDDTINAGAGTDTINGGAGNDVIAGGLGSDTLQGGDGDDVYTVDSQSGDDFVIDFNGKNDIVFDSSVTLDQLWLTRSANDLRIGVIGSTTRVTLVGYFGTGTHTLMRSVSTTTHSLFLGYSTALIDAMTAIQASTPSAMPDSIKAQLTAHWYAGGKAAPQAAPIEITTNEDQATALTSVGAIDPDENIQGYTLGTGPAHGVAVVNALDGKFVYTPDANFNGEDHFSVVVKDADGQATDVAVKVTVNALNDAPGPISVVGGAGLSVVEGGPGSPTVYGTEIGRFAAVDPEGDNVTFSILADANHRFAVSADGILTVLQPAWLDYEYNSLYTIKVRADDGHGGVVDQYMQVAVTNRNEANTLPPTYSMSVNENVLTGTVVGTVAATDPDGSSVVFGQQRYYFLTAAGAPSATSSDDRYTIDAVTGVIKTLAALNFEAGATSVAYTVAARDNQGNTGFNQATSTVTIGITDVNEANHINPTFAMTVDENKPAGTSVGTVFATDDDGAGTVFGQQRYYFFRNGAVSATSWDDRYTIDAVTGVIKTKAAFNFEAGATSVAYTVAARDNQGALDGNQATSTVTIGITDVNEPNHINPTFAMTVDENKPAGTSVGTVFATDDDGAGTVFGQQRYYFLTAAGALSATSSDTRYTIDTVTGVIKTVAAFNFEAGATSVAYTVAARDNQGALDGNQATSTVTIGITDVNEAPTALNWTPSVASVAERDRVASGTTLPVIPLGSFAVVDPDTAGTPFNSYNYTVSDSRFEIVGDVLRLKLGAVLDFEAGSSVAMTVTAIDQAGTFSIQRSVTIAVTNQDDILEGDAGANTLIGQQNRDLLYGLGGNDILDGGAGDDQLDGGAGIDRLLGGSGIDTLYGGDDADTLIGGIGNDVLYGGANTVGTVDRLYGDDGNDSLTGDDGDDYLIGGVGADQIVGGAGEDWADYSELSEGVAATAAVTVDLVTPGTNTGVAAGDTYSAVEDVQGTGFADTLQGDALGNKLYGLAGNDLLRGRAGDDTLVGDAGADTLYGDDGADTLNGGDGDDIIYGGTGNDTLIGGAGNDTLYAESGDDRLDGGAGNDILNGGIDNDTYIVTRTSDADTINNYDPSGADIDVLGFQDSAAGVIVHEDLWFEHVGNDMRISVIGSTASVLIKDWYSISDAATRSNYKIDFIIAGERYSTSINVEGLVGLMATKTKPATAAARDTLMADLNYNAQWATYWGSNAAPALSAIANQVIAEDATLTLTVTATDDITPNAGLQVSATEISGTGLIATSGGFVFGAPNSAGQRSLTIKPKANASGVATIRILAVDAGGVTSFKDFTITVNGAPDQPTIAQFAGGSGTSGLGGIPLNLNVTFPDMDGSEVQEVWIAGVPVGVTLSAGTYDSAAAVWKLTAAQTSGLQVIAPTGWSQNLALTATARATEGGQTAISTAVATTVVINAPPTSLAFTGSVNENAPNATAVGTVTAVDPDSGDTLTYTLIDNANGRFSLTLAGALQVANSALLNYESATSHNITVRVTDSFGQFKDQAFVVAVNNLNEANHINPTYGMTVAENQAIGTIVGTVLATDDDGAGTAFGQQRYYFLSNGTASSTSSDNRYTIDAITGVIKTATVLNFEAGTTSAAYTVVARDNQGTVPYNQAISTVTIGVTDVNEANHINPTYAMTVAENQAIGTIVGAVVATDDDGAGTAFSQQRYYFLSNGTASGTSSDNRYTIDAITGVIKTAAMFNFEAGATSAAYTVVARDNLGAGNYKEASSTVTIGITDLNEPNHINPTYAMTVAENQAVGTIVGTVVATDDDGTGTAFGQQRYYFLSNGTASGTSSDTRYTIDAITGVIKTAAVLNFEAGTTSAGYTVVARDNQGTIPYNQASSTVTIGVTDLNEANHINPTYAMTVAENQAAGTIVGTVVATDDDGSGTAFSQQRYYFLKNGAASGTSSDDRYTIDALTGAIRTAAALNFEVGATSVAYTVVARDNLGAGNYKEASSTVTIGITDVNEANHINPTYAMTVAENQAVGTIVGTVVATDDDGTGTAFGQQRYYFLSNGTASGTSSDTRYTIDAITGVIKTAAVFNFEAGATSAAYTVVARDSQGAAGYKEVASSVTIGIADVNEEHSLAPMTINLAEGPSPGPLVPVANLAPMLNDPEHAAMRWSFADDTYQSGPFQINPTDGTISLISSGIDYEELVAMYETRWVDSGRDPYGQDWVEETVYVGNDPSRATFNLAVKASDGTFSKTAIATVNITDVNEGPQLTSGNHYYVQDDQAEGFFGMVSAMDPETHSSAVTFLLSNLVKREYDISAGGTSDVDNGYPEVSMTSNGSLSFQVPNDGEWEGGVRDHPVLGGRHTFFLDYTYDLIMTDASGVSSTSSITITFMKQGRSSVPPVVLDLDGDGIELIAAATSQIHFDMDLDGIADQTGWVAGDDGFLALDRNGNGVIDDASEISFVSDVAGAMSDVEGLRAYDSNANGFLDAGDARFGSFRIWRDINQDGISQATELFTLPQLGMVQINLSLQLTESGDTGDENSIFATTEYLRDDGTTGIVGDVSLIFDPTKPLAIAPPVILDFDGDGAGLVSIAASKARFDMDGDGVAERTGWIESGDAFLALDRNNDGKITDIAEISFVGDLPGAKTDLEGLKAFDSNGDGILSALDARFAEFKLWFDTNGNGVSDAGEVRSLAEAGLVSLSLSSVAATGRDDGGNIVYGTGTFTRNTGQTGVLLDTGLAYLRGDGTGATGYSNWSGAGTPSTDPNVAKLPGVDVGRQNFSSKGSKYMVSSVNGEMFIGWNKAGKNIDARAGSIGPASVLSFKKSTYGMLSAIVLDLDGDGADSRRMKKSNARFDMNGDGARDDTGWVGQGDGFLVIDRNGDGLINTTSELAFLSDKDQARSEFDALSALDSNKDGKLDASDARFGELRVWVDANDNGVTDAGELKTLADHGIASITLAARAVNENVPMGNNVMIATSAFTRVDGSTGSLGEIGLAYRPAETASASSIRSVLGDWPDAKLAAMRRGIDGGVVENSPAQQAAVEGLASNGDGSSQSTGPETVAPLVDVTQPELRSTLTAPNIDAQLAALRQGLDGDRFNNFLSRVPIARLVANDGDESMQGAQDLPREDVPSGPAEISDLRPVLMAQTMAAFGARSGEAGWRESSGREGARFDYFAT